MDAVRRTCTIHHVPCGYGIASCSCDKAATSCEFDLQISSLQTFTRYPVNINDDGKVVSYDGNNYDVGYTEAATVDGKTYRPFYAINGRSPGPTLIVTENQMVIVNVKNNIRGESITIHWHAWAASEGHAVDGRRWFRVLVSTHKPGHVPIHFQSPTVGNVLVPQPR